MFNGAKKKNLTWMAHTKEQEALVQDLLFASLALSASAQDQGWIHHKATKAMGFGNR